MSPIYPAFIQGIGGPELLIILVIILLLFGAKKLPELAKGLGKSMKEFKKAAELLDDIINDQPRHGGASIGQDPAPARPW